MNFCSGRSAFSSRRSPFGERRQHAGLALGIVVVVLVFFGFRLLFGHLAVRRLPARKLRNGALHAEQVIGGRDVDRRFVERRRRHLRGDEPVPDEAVDRILLGRQKRSDFLRVVLHRRRADRFVRVLRIGLRLEGVRLLRHVVGAERLADVRANRRQRIVGHARRVGAHISNEADGPFDAQPGQLDAFVQLLRNLHRPLHRIARGLLQLAGDERGRGVALALFGRDRRHDVRRAFEIAQHVLRLLLVADLQRLVALLDELRFEVWRQRAGERREQVPVFLGNELRDLLLAIADQLQRHRLHASRAESAANLVPQDRADLVADEPIEHAARLLRVDHLHVDRARMLHRFLHRLLRDLVEHQAVDLFLLRAELFGEVPADRFAFAIGVGRDVDVGGVLRGALQLGNHFLARRQQFVHRRKAFVDVDAELALRQIADVSHRREHLVVASEILVDCFCLRR